jgi:hypothetical protein
MRGLVSVLTCRRGGVGRRNSLFEAVPNGSPETVGRLPWTLRLEKARQIFEVRVLLKGWGVSVRLTCKP